MDLIRTKAELVKRDSSRSSYVSDDRWRLAKSKSEKQLDRLFDQNKDAIINPMEKVALVLASPDFAAGKAAIKNGALNNLETATAFLSNLPAE